MLDYGYPLGGPPHPVIVTIRDNRDYIRVLLYSYYTTITGVGGPPKISPTWRLRPAQRGSTRSCAACCGGDAGLKDGEEGDLLQRAVGFRV